MQSFTVDERERITNMKPIPILLFLAVWKCCDTNSFAVFDSMSNNVNQLTNKVMVVLKSFKNKVKMFIFPDEKTGKYPVDLNLEMKYKMKKGFSDFVEEEAARNIKESSAYRNLRSEPTALMSTPQLAASHGKRIESHVVLTKDGYLLTLHHLKSSNNENEKQDNMFSNCTVLLHHGLLGSSADWILLGPEKSLPYLLTDLNCDVWLTNARGNYYSRGHIWKKIDSKEFWDFSWAEMGQFDLPAIVDYIRKNKNSTELINFIGHSMGATAFLSMVSIEPKYNEYFRMGILLAPLVFMTNVDSPLRILISVANNPPEHLLNLIGVGEFVPSRQIPPWISSKYCKGPEIFCANPLLFISGSIPVEDIWDNSLVARVLYHVPAGGSTNTILHYAQMIGSGKFQKFQDSSKEFSLKKVKVPIVLFSSSEDLLAPISDVLRLFFGIPCPVDHYMIRDKGFKHTDFIWNPEADDLVFKKIIEYLRDSTNCDKASNRIE